MPQEDPSPDCTKTTGLIVGWIRLVGYGIMSIGISFALLVPSSETCENYEYDSDDRRHVTYERKIISCILPLAAIILILLVSTTCFIIQILLLNGIYKRNHKFILPGAILQSIDFYSSAVIAVLSIPGILINFLFHILFLYILICVAYYWSKIALWTLYKDTKKENEENERTAFNAINQNLIIDA